jgi:cytoskeletal protein RodZ
MSGLWRPKKRRNPLLIGVVIVVFVVLLGVFIVANVAGQAYEKDFFTSSQYNPSSSHGFPSNFLGGLLQNKPSCSDFLIQRGDGMFLN